MRTRTRHFAIVAITLAVNLGLDRITKFLAETYLRGTRGYTFLFGSIVARYAENSGAFLSLGAQWPAWLKYAVLLAAPTLLCLYALYHCLFHETDRLKTIFLVSAIAGGLGNLADRTFNNFMVVDFLNFGIGRLRTGVLNVADLSITFGFIAYLMRDKALRRLED